MEYFFFMSFWDSLKNLFKRNKASEVEDIVEKPVVKEVIDEEVVAPIEQTAEEVTVESLAREQEVIDDLYKAEGLSDRVLEMQVALNQKRNKYDISDKKNLNKDGWSQ